MFAWTGKIYGQFDRRYSCGKPLNMDYAGIYWGRGLGTVFCRRS